MLGRAEWAQERLDTQTTSCLVLAIAQGLYTRPCTTNRSGETPKGKHMNQPYAPEGEARKRLLLSQGQDNSRVSRRRNTRPERPMD